MSDTAALPPRRTVEIGRGLRSYVERTEGARSLKIFQKARKPRLFVLAATLTAAALVFPLTQAATAHASPAAAAATRSARDGTKPSIVLVHGAWADSSSWDAVVSRLQAAGYTVYVPPNPLEGLTYDAASIRDFLDTIAGPVILVGHSYGGAVITNAATGDANVRALVYVDAFIPAQGQTVGQLVNAVPGTCTGEAS
jgi:pimeloyl-ACP methyl ester carboxylesterase